MPVFEYLANGKARTKERGISSWKDTNNQRNTYQCELCVCLGSETAYSGLRTTRLSFWSDPRNNHPCWIALHILSFSVCGRRLYAFLRLDHRYSCIYPPYQIECKFSTTVLQSPGGGDMTNLPLADGCSQVSLCVDDCSTNSFCMDNLNTKLSAGVCTTLFGPPNSLFCAGAFLVIL
jgi:hypothetical protein